MLAQAWSRRVSVLRARFGRSAALTVVGLMALLFASNIWVAIRNQQLLSKQDPLPGMEDWFHLSRRDIAKVAVDHPRHTIFGRAGAFYFLESEIAGAHLTVSDWMHWLEWPFEKVSHLDVTVANRRHYINRQAALSIRRRSKHRRLARYSSKRHETARLYLLVGPGNRYVAAETFRRNDVYIIPESVYEKYKAEPKR